MSPGLRVPGALSCLLDTKLAQVPEQSSQQDTTASQMIRLHVLMPRSTRKIQDGVMGYTQVTGTWSGDSLCSMEQRVTYGLVCKCLSTFWGGEGIVVCSKMINKGHLIGLKLGTK